MRSAALQGYPELARSVGLDPSSMMRSVGIDPNCLRHPDIRVSAQGIVELLERSAAKTGITDFGLRLVAARPFSVMGPLGLVVRDEPTVRTALQTITRYLYIHNEAFHVKLNENENERHATLSFTPTFSTPLEMPQSLETAIAVTRNILKSFLGDAWTPVRVRFAHNAPADARPQRRFFGCPVEFAQASDEMVIDRRDLGRRNPMANPELARYAQDYLQAINRPSEVPFDDRIRQLIRLHIATGRCSADRIAQSLGIDRRTLHRHLDELGTTYTKLLASVREELAARYVAGGARTLEDIAQLLGYSETSAFSRWYRKRFGTCPSAMRPQRHRARSSGESGTEGADTVVGG
jgi:AraC-like DNA-binding protein